MKETAERVDKKGAVLKPEQKPESGGNSQNQKNFPGAVQPGDLPVAQDDPRPGAASGLHRHRGLSGHGHGAADGGLSACGL